MWVPPPVNATYLSSSIEGTRTVTRRVVAGASAVIFLLLALMAHLLVGMHDRSAPIVIGAPTRLMLDFSAAQVRGDEGLAALRRVDAGAGTGLAKQAADLSGDLRGAVLVPVNESPLTGRSLDRYEAVPIRVVDGDAWAFTTLNGAYFATGDETAVPTAAAALRQVGVRVEISETTLWDGTETLLRVKGMFLAFLTGCVLLVTLVLYWLAAKARGRALAVLAGTSVARVQLHDLGQLVSLVVGVWVSVGTLSVAVVGVWRGWVFVGVYAQYALLLGALMLAIGFGAAVVMSVLSVPSPSLIARRAPATVGVRRTAVALKAIVFTVVLLMIGPAWAALSVAASQAEQLTRWERLAGYAAVVFPDASDADLDDLAPRFATVVREAEARHRRILFSESFIPEDADPAELKQDYPFQAVLEQRWSGISIVNEAWLDVGVAADRPNLQPVSADGLPPRLRPELVRWFDELWGLPEASAAATVQGLRFLTPTTGTVPVVGSSGDLEHRDDVLLVVVPALRSTFGDRLLLEAASGRGLLFEDATATQRELQQSGLSRDIKVQHAAEAGLLAAQFARYEAWLGTASMIGLGLALAISALISAHVEMLLQARNDFVRRLAGQSWFRALSGRLVPEVSVGAGLALAAVLLNLSGEALVVAVTALALLALSPLAHVVAGRRGFADVVARKL